MINAMHYHGMGAVHLAAARAALLFALLVTVTVTVSLAVTRARPGRR